jgi:hypothetical protein
MVFNLFGMTLANLLASVWPKVSCDFGFPLGPISSYEIRMKMVGHPMGLGLELELVLF